MLSRDLIIEKLKDRNLRAVCRGAGISSATIYNLKLGKDVRESTLKKLSEYLSK